jgi:uncharacterized membrane-anchored protein YitT (DUF2179 family)
MKINFFVILITSLFNSQNVLAKSIDYCDKAVTYKVIDFLQKEEPKSELHLVLDKKNNVIGITDANEIYPEISLSKKKLNGKNSQTIFYTFDTVIINADFLLKAPNGAISCHVTDISMSQDDQDRE